MTFSQIFEESMRAAAQGDAARVEELARLHRQKVEELKKKKKLAKTPWQDAKSVV